MDHTISQTYSELPEVDELTPEQAFAERRRLIEQGEQGDSAEQSAPDAEGMESTAAAGEYSEALSGPDLSSPDGLSQAAAALLKHIDALAAAIERGDNPSSPEVFLKIARPVCVSAENLLPNLNLAVDYLEMNNMDKQAAALRRLSLTLEERLEVLRLFLEQL